jgi:hypothetical protein
MTKRQPVPAPLPTIPPRLYPELDDMVATINQQREAGELVGSQRIEWQVPGGWLTASLGRGERLTPARVVFRPHIQKEIFPEKEAEQ